jgi:hemolysin activation/secretion protein
VGVTYRRLGVDFVTERRVDHFDRPEYVNLGNDLAVELGWSADALGADYDELLFSVSDQQGVALREGAFLRGSVSAAGRVHDDRVDNLHIAAAVVGVVRETPLDGAGLRHTLVGRADGLFTEHLDDDRFLSLGESTGLRGYTNHAITGARRLRATVEDRIFADRQIAHLVALGGIAFVDTGYVWEVGEDIDLGDLATGAGLGLRLAWPAAANEQVVRLDIAWPLREVPGDNGNPKITFLTTTRF